MNCSELDKRRALNYCTHIARDSSHSSTACETARDSILYGGKKPGLARAKHPPFPEYSATFSMLAIFECGEFITLLAFLMDFFLPFFPLPFPDACPLPVAAPPDGVSTAFILAHRSSIFDLFCALMPVPNFSTGWVKRTGKEGAVCVCEIRRSTAALIHQPRFSFIARFAMTTVIKKLV